MNQSQMFALKNTPEGPRIRPYYRFEPRAGEAIIRPTMAGVCATDLEIAQGYMGFTGVMGHEWVGVVEDAPDPAWNGHRVVGDINCPCHTCRTCLAGRPTHCPNRTVLGILRRDGVFAEAFSLPLHNLHLVPDEVTDEAAVFVEPLAAACQILEQVHVKPSHRVVVLGVGRLGQLCARVLALTGADVHALSRNPDRLKYLPAGIGRHESAGTVPVADLVVDCTGNPAGLELATSLVRAGGTIVLKTTVHDPTPQTPTPWVIDEVTLIGSRCGPFEPALRLLASGLVDPRDLITSRYALQDSPQALLAAASRDELKVLLYCQI